MLSVLIRTILIEASTTIWSLDHDAISKLWNILRSLDSFLTRFLFYVNNIEGSLLFGRWNTWLFWRVATLNLIDQLLKVWIIIHGRSHLYWFVILSLLPWNIRQHFFNSRVVGWLNNHANIWIFIYASMSLMRMLVYPLSVILF